ncbi:hypothetical protein LJC34_03180 [Oscillospiraceae bacterium OttesenSCG-928-G22]|nr:hypothetical protein [Oscillospiraceae bacterium OttesenSCG-928-G22]
MYRQTKTAALFAALLLLVSLLTGCKDNTNPSGAPDGEDAVSSLQNAFAAGVCGEDELDMQTGPDISGDLATIQILYPSAWPGDYFGPEVPEYMGSGYLFLLMVTTGEGSEDTPELAEVISLSIYGSEEADIDTYAKAFLENGYAETPESDYSELIKGALENGSLLGYRAFDTDDISVRFLRNTDERGPFLQLQVIRNDRVEARTGERTT